MSVLRVSVLCFFFCISHFILVFTAAAEEIVPRTVIALYDKRGSGIATSYIHVMAEMPLNHLGLNVEYHDIHDPLPDIANRKDVRGVLTWLFSDTQMNAETYFKWASDVADSGKKYVVMGALGIADEQRLSSSMQANTFFEKIGVKMLGNWVDKPFDITYSYNTPTMFLTTDPFKWTSLPYLMMQAVGTKTKVHLSVRKDDAKGFNSDLIVTSPGGGYIAGEYIFSSNIRYGDEVNQWRINPMEFFRQAFATDDLPKPDTTTIAGRRIYYSHIDGDGWNNRTQLEEFNKKPVLSSQVILDKAIKPYPDLPVTLTVIAADIDPQWVGTDESIVIAKDFFAQPQVEAGSHTYSHPFYWQLFADGDQRREITYLPFYTTPTWQPQNDLTSEEMAMLKSTAPTIPIGYAAPRAFAYEPFSITKEIEGSIQLLATLLPAEKEIELFSWSGNCSPWEEAISLTRKAGVQNINGGDSRYDPEYPDYASLAPIGRQVGNERQIYASTSNENTYTNIWSENFHAHGYLRRTLENSESPIRLKPFNIYYHLYTGEKEASLTGLIANLEYARSQNIAPITASHFTRIAEGFYSTQIISVAANTWRIKNRGALQTIRFDRKSLQSVDFLNSTGVIGQRHLQGSLYVYLDASVDQPVIALKAEEKNYAAPENSMQYLLESRWVISNVVRKENGLDFTAQGFGPGEMVWQMPSAGRYRVNVAGKTKDIAVSRDRRLKLILEQNSLQPLRVSITAV
jgi:hypothetical protein